MEPTPANTFGSPNRTPKHLGLDEGASMARSLHIHQTGAKDSRGVGPDRHSRRFEMARQK